MRAVILMAGMGSRLGTSLPKCLTPLGNGETILSRQLSMLKGVCDSIVGVVGYKKEEILDFAPDVVFVYNPNYKVTNTSKSLLKALRQLPPEDTLWINGDVVCMPEAVRLVAEYRGNAVGVTYSACGDEEVKFKKDSKGNITELSKKVIGGLGEAVGINRVAKEDYAVLIGALEACDDNDYFEAGMEAVISLGMRFQAVDIGNDCVEIDFKDDLDKARTMLEVRGVNVVVG